VWDVNQLSEVVDSLQKQVKSLQQNLH